MMIDTSSLLVWISAMCVSISFVPYIYATLKGETKPVRMTWGLWSLIMIIGTLAHYRIGADKSLVFALVDTIGVSFVFLLTFFKGEAGHTYIQRVSFVLCIVSIMLWRYFADASVGLYLSILADFLAAIPTFEHAYKKPHEETPVAYMLTAIGGTIAVIAEGFQRPIAVVLPLYIASLNGAIATTIYVRRRLLLKTHNVPKLSPQ